MNQEKINMLLNSVELPKEQITHDLALLIVKSKMENGSIKTLGEIFESYISEVHGMKRVVDEYMGE